MRKLCPSTIKENSLVIFDLDGTLYQAHLTAVLAVKKGLAELGASVPSDDRICSLIGDTMETFCRKLVPALSDEDLSLLAAKMSNYEKQYIKDCGKLYVGIKEMLIELNHMGYRISICSNGRYEYINTVLNTCGLADIVSLIKGRELGKTKTDLIRETLEEMNVNAEDAIVVGDTLYDIEAARNNKIVSIGVTYGYGGRSVLKADYIANNTEELLYNVIRISLFSHITCDLRARHVSVPYIIGINGVDTSGKSIFAEGLEIYLRSIGFNTQLIHIDDFHNEKKVRMQGTTEIESYLNYAFNYSLLEEEILLPVSNGTEIDKELFLLDLDTDSFTNVKRYVVNRETVLIIEGVLLYRDPINKYFSKRVFLDIDFDTVIKRAEIRDVPQYGKEFMNKYKEKYIPIQKKYIDDWHPLEQSDIVIDNNNYLRPIIKMSK